jgi:cholesterol transport system auxiliary component
MNVTRTARTLALLALVGLAAGCSTLSALSSSTEALDAYTLTASSPVDRAAASRTRLLVETPTASGGLDTDRILVKPGLLQVQYVAGARWIDPAPVLVQSLVVESIANARLVRFVSTSSGTVLPDYTLLIDLRDFQAELGPAGGTPMRVVVRMDASMVRDLDREVVATRRIEAIAAPSTDDAPGIVAAFDTVMQRALQDLLAWTGSVTSGRGGS